MTDQSLSSLHIEGPAPVEEIQRNVPLELGQIAHSQGNEVQLHFAQAHYKRQSDFMP